MQAKSVSELLKQIETFIREGKMSKGNVAGEGTFVCITEVTPQGVAYHQNAFELLPPEAQRILNGKSVGHIFDGRIKLVGVFDVWPEAFVQKTENETTKTPMAC